MDSVIFICGAICIGEMSSKVSFLFCSAPDGAFRVQTAAAARAYIRNLKLWVSTAPSNFVTPKSPSTGRVGTYCFEFLTQGLAAAAFWTSKAPSGVEQNKNETLLTYRTSANSFCRNYSFLTLTLCGAETIQGRKLFAEIRYTNCSTIFCFNGTLANTGAGCCSVRCWLLLDRVEC